MNIVVITDDLFKNELLAQEFNTDAHVSYWSEIPDKGTADCYIDLLFDSNQAPLQTWINERVQKLANLKPALILVNSVVITREHMPPGFIRFNGWPTFLKRHIVEASSLDETLKPFAEKIFTCFGKKIQWFDGDPQGFVTPRVISMIINEAYYALEENVSTKEEIDIAMRLGTNYPYGPFEWSRLIGVHRVYQLLKAMSRFRGYTFSSLLEKEALQS